MNRLEKFEFDILKQNLAGLSMRISLLLEHGKDVIRIDHNPVEEIWNVIEIRDNGDNIKMYSKGLSSKYNYSTRQMEYSEEEGPIDIGLDEHCLAIKIARHFESFIWQEKDNLISFKTKE
jgi:hypothetical protein